MKIVLDQDAAQANAAKAALQHGQSWTAVAKKYSIDPTTKNKGGVLTNVTKGQQDAALSNAAFAAPVNKLIGPIKGQFGYYVVEVTKITPATQQSLAESSALIKQTLTSQAQTTAANAVVNAVPRRTGRARPSAARRTRWLTAAATRRRRRSTTSRTAAGRRRGDCAGWHRARGHARLLRRWTAPRTPPTR